jgi:hypothetical protein
VFANTDSSAPFLIASASDTTFSAYDVVFRPATALFSLRVQGERAARPVATISADVAATTTVCGPSERPEPSGPTPSVTVIRRRPACGAAARTASTPPRTLSWSTGAMPMPAADRSRRLRWRVRANA